VFFLEEIKPQIFVATFHQSYHMNMTFKRYNEGSGHDDSRWRLQAFTIHDFDEFYAKQGADLNNSYAEDWGGFMLSGKEIANVIKTGIPDLNKWDQVMMTIFSMCAVEYPDLNFSLIGASRDVNEVDPTLLRHEIAHALYDIEPAYRQKMDRLFNKIPPDLLDRILQILKSWGYCDEHLVDEVQAYLSTGIDGLDDFDILSEEFDLKTIQQAYIDIFTNYEDKPFKKRLIYPHLD